MLKTIDELVDEQLDFIPGKLKIRMELWIGVYFMPYYKLNNRWYGIYVSNDIPETTSYPADTKWENS